MTSLTHDNEPTSLDVEQLEADVAWALALRLELPGRDRVNTRVTRLRTILADLIEDPVLDKDDPTLRGEFTKCARLLAMPKPVQYMSHVEAVEYLRALGQAGQIFAAIYRVRKLRDIGYGFGPGPR